MIYFLFFLVISLTGILVIVVAQDTYHLGTIVFKEEYTGIYSSSEKEYFLHILVKKNAVYETKKIRVTNQTFYFASVGDKFPIKL